MKTYSLDIKLNRTKHIQPKKSKTSKEQKQNVHHAQKKDKKFKKIKEEKYWRTKGKFGFACHAITLASREKIPSSSVRSLSPKSSVFFFVRGPIRTKKEKMEENRVIKNTHSLQKMLSKDKKVLIVSVAPFWKKYSDKETE